jgi:hypothetical protein
VLVARASIAVRFASTFIFYTIVSEVIDYQRVAVLETA